MGSCTKAFLTLASTALGLTVITALLLAVQAAPTYGPQWILQTNSEGVVSLGEPAIALTVIWCIVTFCTTVAMIVAIQEHD